MTISEKKMQIVIDNYFKSECDVNTSIRQAFEKGFRIGIKKVPSAEPERKKGKWIYDNSNTFKCSKCNKYLGISCGNMKMNFCPNCEADMRGEKDEHND